MKNEFDLNYSNDALLTRVIFLASQNDLNIFVEDTNKEYEYEEIFERLFSEDLRINCIFPTGGKPFLEEAFTLFGNSCEYGKTFFIADGDFDEALGREMIVADNFVYLKRYNIESYLLHKDAIIRYMRPKLRKTFDVAESILKYDEWYNTVAPFLKKLFTLHFVVQKYCYGTENVGRGYARFLESNGFPKETEYDKYRAEILAFIPDLDSKLSEATADLERIYGDEGVNFVCGKCYIGSLKLYLNTFVKKGIGEDDIKAVLVSNFDVSALKYVLDKLCQYMVA